MKVEDLDLTEAVEEACRFGAADIKKDWDAEVEPVKVLVRDWYRGVLEAALPCIIDQLTPEDELDDETYNATQPIYASQHKLSNGTVTMVCSLCLYRTKTEEDTYDPRLTVINGLLLCVDHANLAYLTPSELSKWVRKSRNEKLFGSAIAAMRDFKVE